MGRYYPLRLPDVRKQRAYDCGPAAASAVWRFFGEAEKPVPCTALDGTDPRTLESCLRPELAVCSGEMGLADLAFHTTQGRPVVCLVRDSDGVGHYVVVGGLSLTGGGVGHGGAGNRGQVLSSPPGPTVVMQDPDRGPCREAAADFLARWEDVDRWGFRYRRWGLAAWRRG